MPECAICDAPITPENDSGEHIIQNAIGGRLKVRGCLCITCNNSGGKSAGKAWDAELARQLNPLSLLFEISRERGEPPAQNFPTLDGRLRRLHPDGTSTPPHPTYEETKTDAGIAITATLRSMAEAPRILAGIKRKYPQVDIDAIREQLEVNTSYDNTPIRMDIVVGGHVAGRSMVKSALCMAVHAGIDPKVCTRARAYLAGDDSNPPFGFDYLTNFILIRPEGRVFHCVAVSGNAKSGLLIGYLEYFCFHHTVVLLADRYDGPDVHQSYAVDPLTGERLNLQFDLTLSREQIDAIFRYERTPEMAMQDAFSKIMPIAIARSLEREKDRAISNALRSALADSGIKPGAEITIDRVPEINVSIRRGPPCPPDPGGRP